MARVSLIAAFIALLIAAPVHAGSGRFVNGRLDVFVTIGGTATAAELAEIQERFTQASRLLYDATDGQVRFGDVRIFNNNTGLEFADALLTLGNGGANANSCQLGVFGESLDIFSETDIFALPEDDAFQTVAHEFAHYAFQLFDEYKGSAGTAECVPATAMSPSTACLMDHYRLAQYDDVSEFCWSGNHDPDGDTDQDEVHGHSCWEQIVAAYPMLTAPAAAPVDAEPAGFVDPNYQVFENPVLRVALVLDNSGSMNGAGGAAGVTRIEDLNTFARLFIDQMGTADVELSIVNYNSAATGAFPVTLLDTAATVTNAKNALPATASGNTNIGGGLALGRDRLTGTAAPGPLVLILMTDGFHNWPPGDAASQPLAVLPSIVDADIHVHTVALGDSTNEPLLRDIAKQSGGIFWKANNSIRFAPIFSALAAIARGGSILDAPQTNLLAAGQAHVSATQQEVPDTLLEAVRKHGTSSPALRPVFVEKDSREAAFNLGWAEEGVQLEMILHAPDGTIIRPENANTQFILHRGERYRSWVVRTPQSGVWHYAVVATNNPAGATYVMQPTVINPVVRAFANAEKRGPVIHLEAVARDRVPVTNITVSALMTDPTGGTRFITLRDDGTSGDLIAADGMYSADIAGLEATGNGVYHFEVSTSAEEGVAQAISGEIPLRPVDNRTIYTVRTFQRNFAVDVVVSDFPGGNPGDPDNDGILGEGTNDTDGDGTVDRNDHDSDGDDLSDRDEGSGDADGDDVPNYQDTDSDNDGVKDNEDPNPYGDDGKGSGNARGRLAIGYFMGGYLFDDDFPVDRELLFGFRFGKGLTRTIDLESEIALASATDDAGQHGFITNLNLLATANFGAGKIRPLLSLGLGWFDFRQFSPAVDDSGIGPFIGAGLKFHVRPRLAGRIEARYINLSTLNTEADYHPAILWGIEIGF